MTNTERVSKLRASAVAPAVCYLEFYLHFYRYFQEKELPYRKLFLLFLELFGQLLADELTRSAR